MKVFYLICNLLVAIVVTVIAKSSEDDNNNVLDFFNDFGGIPDDSSREVCYYNTKLLSNALQYNASNHTFILARTNQTFHFYHGVYASHIQNVKLINDGTLRFERDNKEVIPKRIRHPKACFMIDKSKNITLTSTTGQRGLFDGRGSNWWGVPVVGYLEIAERRPRLLRFNLTSDILIENMIFQDSPYHTVYFESVKNVLMRHCSIVARRTTEDGHTWIDLSAFNTDGIDVSGTNVHIHDVDIWVQDDCIAVKDSDYPPFMSSNMLFNNINCSGVGLVIGSIGRTHVNNITFANSYIHKSVKGIYMKFHHLDPSWNTFFHNRTAPGIIEDIMFSNITMEKPLQWPIWIGPAQQSDERRPCHANPCSLCWPQNPVAECNTVPKTKYKNITLSNIIINNPKMSPGVILGGNVEHENLIERILFHNVKVTKGIPVPQSLIDRKITFPGLLQPINDKYIPDYYDDIYKRKNEYDNINNNDLSTDFGLLFMKIFVVACSLIVSMFIRRILHYYWVNIRRSINNNNNNSKDDESNNDQLDDTPLLLHSDNDNTTQTKETKTSLGFHSILSKWVVAWDVFFTVLVYYYIFIIIQWGTPKWNRTNHYFRCRGVIHGFATSDTWPIPSCFAHPNNNNNNQFNEMSILATLCICLTIIGTFFTLCRYNNRMQVKQPL